VSSSVYRAPESLLDQVVSIALVGAGGTGSALTDQLASLEATLVQLGHPGFDVTVYDPDRVTATNLGRQRFTRADLGLHKAIVLVHRINLFYGVRWKAHPGGAEDSPRGPAPALLLTCVDSAPARIAVARWARSEYNPTLWLDCGNGALQGQVVLGHLGGERSALASRLPNVLDLFPELHEMKDDDTPSCSTAQALRKQALPVNRVAATIALDLLYSLFRFGRLEHHGAQFTVDPLRVTPIPIDPKAWELYGYRATAPQPVPPARKMPRR